MGNIEPVFVEDRSFDIRNHGKAHPRPIEVAGCSSADVAESLESDRRSLEWHAEHVGCLHGAFRHAVPRHQFGDRNVIASQRQSLFDTLQPGAAFGLESGLERMRQAHQLAGGDDVVFAGAEIGAGGVTLRDEGTDGVDEATQHGRRLRRRRIVIDP